MPLDLLLGSLPACQLLRTILILGMDSKAMQPIYLHSHARGPSKMLKRGAFRFAKPERHGSRPTRRRLLINCWWFLMTFNSWRMYVFQPNPTTPILFLLRGCSTHPTLCRRRFVVQCDPLSSMYLFFGRELYPIFGG